MHILQGKQISKGIVTGKICWYRKNKIKVQKASVEDVAFELRRFEEAKQLSVGQLKVLYEQAVQTVGQKDALIFGVHQMLIEDLELSDAICKMIELDRVNAEHAVFTVAHTYMERLRGQERAEDIQDVTERILSNLSEQSDEKYDFNTAAEPMILVAEALLPSEIIKFRDSSLAGIVLQDGTQNSHTAILARTMGIPMLGCKEEDIKSILEGEMAVLDGTEGKLYLQPDTEFLNAVRENERQAQEEQKQLQGYKEMHTEMSLCANVANISDAKLAREHEADGIGLVRTEMLWLSQGRLPSEEEQFQVYRQLAEKMKEKKVVIRTWDIGEDKLYDGLETDCRGIRLCLSHSDIFKTQLRAICRASYYGQVAVLFPMITSLQEVKQAKQMLYAVQKELEQEQVAFDKSMKMGVMLETPAAIVLSRELAREVDFCSVGTNDLIQYTFSIDRHNPAIDISNVQYQSVILNMIQTAVKNVHAEGKQIGICGEMGADETLTHAFVKMGVDELSVVPSVILHLRKKVLECEQGISE